MYIYTYIYIHIYTYRMNKPLYANQPDGLLFILLLIPIPTTQRTSPLSFYTRKCSAKMQNLLLIVLHLSTFCPHRIQWQRQ